MIGTAVKMASNQLAAMAADLRAALDPAVLFERAFGFPPLDWQRDYVHAIGPVVINAGRQTGKSTAAALLAVHEVMYTAEVTAAIVSPSLRQSQEIAGKARTALRNLNVGLVQDSATTLQLRNGSRILSLPGTSKSVRGWSASLLILDEAAYLDAATWEAVKALTAATGGRLIVSSTPAMAEGMFYELVTGDAPGWTRYTVPSASVPTIAPSFLDAERASMSPDAFGREYECTFGTISTLPRLFSEERLRQLFPEEVA